MRKKVLSLLLVAALGIGGIAAGGYVETETEIASVEAAAKPSASAVASAVKQAYGSDYLPNYRLEKADIRERYGVSSAWYTSAFAEVPMISAHVDELVIIKTKNASAKKKTLKAIRAYQKKLKENTCQYPANLTKIQASKVYTNGKYVCFIMLGTVSDSVLESGDDAKIIKAYQSQNQKAVNAIKKKVK